MNHALLMHRLHFGFTVTFHYLFPQLTMGLAPLIVLLKTIYLRTDNILYDRAARFWAKIFGVSFVMGVGDAKNPISNNVGGVKHVFERTSACTPRRAPFRSRE
jgi:hypothetical protein